LSEDPLLELVCCVGYLFVYEIILFFCSSHCQYSHWWAVGTILSSVGRWQCALWHSGSVYGVQSSTVVFTVGDFLFISSATCRRMYHLTTNGKKADGHHKQTLVRNVKRVNSHADHSYSRQRCVAIPRVMCSMIDYHSNIVSNFLFLLWTPLTF